MENLQDMCNGFKRRGLDKGKKERTKRCKVQSNMNKVGNENLEEIDE